MSKLWEAMFGPVRAVEIEAAREEVIRVVREMRKAYGADSWMDEEKAVDTVLAALAKLDEVEAQQGGRG